MGTTGGDRLPTVAIRPTDRFEDPVRRGGRTVTLPLPGILGGAGFPVVLQDISEPKTPEDRRLGWQEGPARLARAVETSIRE